MGKTSPSRKSTVPKLTLYTSSQCPHCRQLAAWLRQQRIGFRSFDIHKNRRAALEFQRLGGRSVPLLQLGERVITGFDRKRIRQALRAAGPDQD